MAFALVVVVIAAFALAYLLFGAARNVANRVQSSNTIAATYKKIDEAIVRFVMLYKRLPCPADGVGHSGAEAPQPDAYNLKSGTQTCDKASGIVPWKALDLAESDVLDPWGRYISFRVFDGALGFTRTAGLDLSNCINESVLTGYSTGSCATTYENTVGDFLSGKGVAVNDLGNLKSGIAYVLISMGESGLGSYSPGGQNSPPGGTKELLNAAAAGTYWILSASSREVAPDDTSHFDDVLSYTSVVDLANAARLARAWPLQITLDGTQACGPPTPTPPASCTTKSPSGTLFTDSSLKMWTDGVTGHGAVTATATITGTPHLCTISGGGSTAVSACASAGDQLSSTLNNKLTFDFKVRRATAMIRLQGLQHTGSSDEQAVITFYNGATQVYQVTKPACHTGGNAIAQFSITPVPAGTEFTSIEVRATTDTSGGTSSFSVSAIAACYPYTATCQVPSYSSADNC